MVKLLTRRTKMINKIKIIAAISIVSLSFLGFFIPATVDAVTTQTPLTDADCKPLGVSKIGPFAGPPPTACKKNPADCPSGKFDPKDDSKCLPLGSSPVALKDNPIIGDLNLITNVLAALVGVVVVGTIILGGVQFAAAGDKAEAISAAKQRIINGLTALAAFLFIYAFLQWLIPGGVF